MRPPSVEFALAGASSFYSCGARSASPLGDQRLLQVVERLTEKKDVPAWAEPAEAVEIGVGELVLSDQPRGHARRPEHRGALRTLTGVCAFRRAINAVQHFGLSGSFAAPFGCWQCRPPDVLTKSEIMQTQPSPMSPQGRQRP